MIVAGPVVLVRLPNWLGDTVMALPALAALRRALPDALIALVGRWARLLDGQGVADAAVAYPSRLSSRWRLGGALRSWRPDSAVVMPNSLESALAARRWGARVRIGYDADLRGGLLTHTLPLPSPRRHQVEEYCALVEAGGAAAPPEPPRWRLARDPEAEGRVDRLLESLEGGSRPGGLVGLHLGAAFGSSKLWPPASFADLAGRIESAGLTPVLLGAGADAGTAAAVQAAAGRPLPSLVGRDAPEILPRLLARMTCLVSGDTGVAHLAAAVGTRTVTLFGPTDPGLTRPLGPRARALEGRAPCAPCFLPRCPIEHPCMRGLGSDAVAGAVLDGRAA